MIWILFEILNILTSPYFWYTVAAVLVLCVISALIYSYREQLEEIATSILDVVAVIGNTVVACGSGIFYVIKNCAYPIKEGVIDTCTYLEGFHKPYMRKTPIATVPGFSYTDVSGPAVPGFSY